MIVITKIIATLMVVVYLLRKHIQIGHAMLAGSIIIFLLESPTLGKAASAIQSTLRESSTWEVFFAMFFVMCLEHLLRTSGTIEGFMATMKSLLRSDRVLLALMPAFLGLLPSLGGALFSAPMVEQASKNYPLTPENKATINYWFRHIWEYANPIIPGVLLASQMTSIPLGTFVTHLAGYTLVAFILGWIFLLTGRNFRPDEPPQGKAASASLSESPLSLRYPLLALGPIIANLILVIVFHLSAAISMGTVVLGMVFILRLNRGRLTRMLMESFDKKLLWGVLSIMFFQHVLTASGMVQELVAVFQDSNLPIMLMLGLSAFVLGILTGGSQGVVAVLFPIIAVLAHGDVNMVSIAFIMGIAGTMISPAHLCLIVSGEYFKADIFKLLRPVLFLEGIIVGVVVLTQVV